jgi:hypothetical protein
MNAESTLVAYLSRAREPSGLSMEGVPTGSRIVPRLVVAKPTEDAFVPGVVRELRSPGRFQGAPGQVVRDATVPGEPRP